MPRAQLGEFRCLVYHDCWRVIMSSIQSDACSGNVYQLGIGNRLHGTPLVAMKNTDYEEGFVVSFWPLSIILTSPHQVSHGTLYWP
jgi:hypothetical protein